VSPLIYSRLRLRFIAFQEIDYLYVVLEKEDEAKE
jgi:hypothetical protein